jgi:hypothetical protein
MWRNNEKMCIKRENGSSSHNKKKNFTTILVYARDFVEDAIEKTSAAWRSKGLPDLEHCALVQYAGATIWTKLKAGEAITSKLHSSKD